MCLVATKNKETIPRPIIPGPRRRTLHLEAVLDLDGGFCTGRAVLDLDGRLCTWTRFWTPTVVFERGGGGVDVCSIIFFLWFVFVSFNSLGLYSLFNKNADRDKISKTLIR